jgi:parvulin-like peptidyl-prolyl isomerase
MAFMNKMRDSMPVVFAGLAGVFLLMIIFEWGGQGQIFRKSGPDGETIGVVDGRKISIAEYNQEVSNLTENAKAEQKKTELSQPDIEKAQNQAWDNLVIRALIRNSAEKLGIIVTDQEIRDQIYDNPPEFARRQFTDSLGQFHQKEYFEAIRNPKNDTIVRKALIDPTREQLLITKWQGLMSSSVRISDADMWDRYLVDNAKANVEVVRIFPKLSAREYMKSVSDAEMKAYFDTHLSKYKSEESRKIKFVMFPEVQTPKDSIQSIEKLETVRKRLAEAPLDQIDSVAQGLTTDYSVKPYQPPTLQNPSKWGTLTNAAELENATVGQTFISGRAPEGTVSRIVQIVDTGATFYHARHILIGYGKGASENKDSAKTLAEQVYQQLKGGANFGDLARKYSTDPGSTRNGGDLKWVGPRMFVKQVDDVGMSAPLNVIQAPVSSDFGYHIIEVLGRSNKSFKIATVPVDLRPSSQTIRMIQQQAQYFHDQAAKSGFDQAAKNLGYRVITDAPAVTKKGQQIFNDKGFSEWIFTGAKGDISSPVHMQNANMTLVAELSEVTPAGSKSFDEVKEQIRPILAGKKRIEALEPVAKQIRSMLAPGDELGKLAATTNDTSLKPIVLTMGPAESVAGLNTEYVVNNWAFAANPGDISPALKGDNGFYIVRLISKNPGTKDGFAQQKATVLQTLLREKQQRFIQGWIEKNKDAAKIEDYRNKK